MAAYPGVYHVKGREELVSKGRIRSWVDKFKRMARNVANCWGHNLDKPASKVHDLEVGPNGELVVVGEVPPGMDVDAEKGALVDPQKHLAVYDVSLSAKSFTDGSGKHWDDAIDHIALTTQPVAHGTPGFEPIQDSPLPAGAVRFSLADIVRPADQPPTYSLRFSMAEEKPEKDEKPAKKKEGEADLEGGAINIDEIKSKLASAMNIKLPDDTNKENFLEHLWVAIHALAPDEPEELTEETPPGGGMGTMMSLTQHTDPVVRKMAERQLAAGRKTLKNRIDGLVNRGLKPSVAAKLNERFENPGLQMSFDDDGNVTAPRLEFALSLLESQLPAKNPYGKSGVQLSVAEHPVPLDENKDLREAGRKAGERLSTGKKAS